MSAANRKRKQNAKANNSKVDKLADIENGERNEKSICDDETDITERVIDGHPDYWRLKYEKLLEQRTTEAEQKLVDITKKAADQLTSSDARVKTLESQVTDLETRLSTTTSNHVQETGKQMESKHCQTMEEPTNKDEKKVSEIQMVNGFYNLLTGITIQPTKTSDTVDTFCCSFTNGPPGHAFMLHYNKIQQEVEFNPSVSDETMSLRKRARSIGRKVLPLPEFLSEDIYFDVNSAPRFLYRVLRSVHEQQKSSSE